MRGIDWREATEKREIRIRTRGPIQTREVLVQGTGEWVGEGIKFRGPAPTEGKKPLEKLVADLRKRANGSPIAVVIHGWKKELAQTFLGAISPLLDEEDALWLVPSDRAELAEAPFELPGAVVLDIGRDTDRRTYTNLVADLVFFPDGKPEEIDRWHKRVEAVIVSPPDNLSIGLIEKVRQNRQDTYHWSVSKPEGLVRI